MHKTYICHNRYESKAMDVNNILIRYGKTLKCNGGILTYKGRPVCVYRSRVGKEFFAPNDDGEGLHRGAITHAIAFAPRVHHSSVNGAQQRFSDEELEILYTRWKEFIRQDCDFLLFTDDFFELPVPKLREIAASINIDTRGM